MTKAVLLDRNKAAISHGLELYSYLITKESRKKMTLYEFEKSYVVKENDIGKYQTDEKQLKSNKDEIKKSKKIIQLL